MAIGTVLVGIDGSPNGRAALEEAIEVAVAASARVVAVHAVGLLTHLRPDEEPVPSASSMDELSAVFEGEWCQPLADAGVPYSSRLEGGEPVGVLLRLAEEASADMVVVGCRGHRRLVDVPLGSTAHQVIMRSRWPVLVVPLSDGGA